MKIKSKADIKTRKIGYLTIDDAPFPDFIERVDFLESKGIKALWFCLGFRMVDMKEALVYAIRKGHILGNHFYTHVHACEHSIDEIKEQIVKTDRLIEEVYQMAGVSRPFKAFRFPYLDNGMKAEYRETDWSDSKVVAIQNYLKTLGYRLPYCEGINYAWYKEAGYLDSIDMSCTYDSFDWCHNSSHAFEGYETIEAIFNRVDEDVPEGGRGLNCRDSNEIILMHAYTDMVLFKGLIHRLLEKNIQFQLPIGGK